MATTGSAERPGSPASAAAGPARPRAGRRSGSGSRSGSRSGSGSGPPEEDVVKTCAACAGAPSGGGGSGRGQPACPLCPARGHCGRGGERLRRRSDPEKTSSRPGRRDSDSRRELFVSPVVLTKPAEGFPFKIKLPSDDRDETRRRTSLTGKDEFGPVRREDEPGVLSDSENEEPISRRIRNISAFFRRTRNVSSLTAGCQRSRSCTDPVEERGGKLKAAAAPVAAAMMERVGISHSFAAGILLSSENSRSASAPITAPERRLTWRAVLTSSTPPGLPPPPPRPERSISPESNDSISEELNHFKPIVCSPCTPPKRLADGRLMEPTIVKSTPRNLSGGLQKATSYEASPAVLQKWRQIELDRQSLKVKSRATLTSPVSELAVRTGGGDERTGGAAAKTRRSPAAAADRLPSTNKRRLLFEPPAADADGFHKQSVKIRVPAIRYSADPGAWAGSDREPAGGTPEPGRVGALFSRKQSFSPYTKHSGFQSCKLVPKDSQSPRKESDNSINNQSTSRRGKKRKQKTKHLDLDLDLDPELKRSRGAGPEALEERSARQLQQDRALAMKLQRQFDLENQSATCRRSPDTYYLRSWMSNQSRRRCGLRSSRRIVKKL